MGTPDGLGILSLLTGVAGAHPSPASCSWESLATEPLLRPMLPLRMWTLATGETCTATFCIGDPVGMLLAVPTGSAGRRCRQAVPTGTAYRQCRQAVPTGTALGTTIIGRFRRWKCPFPALELRRPDGGALEIPHSGVGIPHSGAGTATSRRGGCVVFLDVSKCVQMRASGVGNGIPALGICYVRNPALEMKFRRWKCALHTLRSRKCATGAFRRWKLGHVRFPALETAVCAHSRRRNRAACTSRCWQVRARNAAGVPVPDRLISSGSWP